MGTRSQILAGPGGFSLLELLFVLAVLGICGAIGVAGVAQALQTREARGAAQDWQAAAAWAQVGVLWHGGDTRLTCRLGTTSLEHDFKLCGGSLGKATPSVAIESNVTRWCTGSLSMVAFGGLLASPDGGGSLYFGAGGLVYRVVVRPTSGLTVRSLTERMP
jgi:prepilin-type N-terminal cleavage/methylation domain-containing protein